MARRDVIILEQCMKIQVRLLQGYLTHKKLATP